LGGLPEPGITCDILLNGNFDVDKEPWYDYGCDVVWNNGKVDISNIETVDNPPWGSGFFQEGFSLIQGREYILSFKASATSARTIVVMFSVAGGPTIFIDQNVQVGTTESTITLSFTNNAVTTNSADMFIFLGNSAAELTFDDFDLNEIACNVCGDNVLLNSRFDTQVDPWYDWNCVPAVSNQQVHISAITGANPWDSGFFQQNLELIQGQTYTLQFDARSNTNRMMYVKAAYYGAVTHQYMYEQVSLSSTMENYELSFIADINTVTDGRIEFYIGQETADIYMDNIILLDGNCNNSGDCLWSMDVQNPVLETVYETENNITSAATIDAPKNVSFNTSVYIQMNPGFEVELGAEFLTILIGCTN